MTAAECPNCRCGDMGTTPTAEAATAVMESMAEEFVALAHHADAMRKVHYLNGSLLGEGAEFGKADAYTKAALRLLAEVTS